jgi:hypothetical protein
MALMMPERAAPAARSAPDEASNGCTACFKQAAGSALQGACGCTAPGSDCSKVFDGSIMRAVCQSVGNSPLSLIMQPLDAQSQKRLPFVATAECAPCQLSILFAKHIHHIIRHAQVLA